MSTGLVSGLTLEQAQDAVRRKAVELLADGDNDIALWTETGNRSVLIGVARRGVGSFTMMVPREQYDGLKLMEWLERGGDGIGHSAQGR